MRSVASMQAPFWDNGNLDQVPVRYSLIVPLDNVEENRYYSVQVSPFSFNTPRPASSQPVLSMSMILPKSVRAKDSVIGHGPVIKDETKCNATIKAHCSRMIRCISITSYKAIPVLISSTPRSRISPDLEPQPAGPRSSFCSTTKRIARMILCFQHRVYGQKSTFCLDCGSDSALCNICTTLFVLNSRLIVNFNLRLFVLVRRTTIWI